MKLLVPSWNRQLAAPSWDRWQRSIETCSAACRQVSALHEALTVPHWWRHERKRLAVKMTSQSAVKKPRQSLESKAPCHLQCRAVELADIFAEMSKKGDHFALRSGRPERGCGALEASIHILDDSPPPASPSSSAEVSARR